MKNKTKKALKNFRLFLPVSLWFVLTASLTVAQDLKKNSRGDVAQTPTAKIADKSTAMNARYVYEFAQPDFYIRHILIQHDATGKGSISFARREDEKDLTEPLEVAPAALERIKSLWKSLDFLNSTEDYQTLKQFPHLGTMRLKMASDAKEREAEFNWTNNKNAFALTTEYRRLSDQALLVFDINLARANRPLDTPKLVLRLEELFKRNELSDARQLLPFLQDLSTDERIPLMSRNAVNRIIKKIDKP